MKKLLKFTLCGAWLFFAFAVMAQNAEDILKNALEQSGKINFSAKMENPFPYRTIQAIILPYAPNWKYYQKYDGELLFRLEMYTPENKLQEIYWKNASGIYGSDNDGFYAQIVDVPYLWMPALLRAKIPPAEWEACSYKVTETTYEELPCYEVTTFFPDDEDLMRKLSGDEDFWYKNKRDSYLENRTFIRKFIIDRNTGLILARHHYNKNGKEIFTLSLKEINYQADLPDSLFASPQNIPKKYIRRQMFAADVLNKTWVDPEQIKAEQSILNTRNMLIGAITTISVLLAIVLLIKFIKR